jgi:hypothetical protein
MSNELEPVAGEEEELDLGSEGEEEEQLGSAAVGELEGEEEEMPDDLLSPSELEERNRERAAAAPAAAAREPEDRSALVSELREIFGGLRQPAAPAREEPAAPARQELPALTIAPEKAREIQEKILSDPSGAGLVNALLWAAGQGEQRAVARLAQSNEGQAALESSGESFADRFVARKLRDPDTKFGKAIEPVFQSMLEEFNLADLARMPRGERENWLDATWERATGRALLQKATTKRPPSPGVARGAGSRAGAPVGRGRVVLRMTEAQKRDLRASAPNLFKGEEGEKLFLRQVWEIEHGVTSSAAVRGMTRESLRFADAVGFGG